MTHEILAVERLELRNGNGTFEIQPFTWRTQNQHQVLLLSGPNGSGKTTLLNVISGHVKPSRGHAFLKGRRTSGLGVAHAARLGVVRGYQTPLFCDDLSVWENISLPTMRFSAMSVNPLRDRASDLLAEVNLAHLLDRRPTELSFGERRMVELLRLQLQLRSSPRRLLLLDEPLAGLDSSRRSKAVKLIADIASANVPIVLVEHALRDGELGELSPQSACLRLVAESQAKLKYYDAENSSHAH